jgi:hypothetical protein
MLFLDWVNLQYREDLLGSRVNNEYYFKEMPNIFTGSEQATLEIGKHYNGSGPSTFGGAKEWGHIRLDISIPVEVPNAEAQLLIVELVQLLNKHDYIKK